MNPKSELKLVGGALAPLTVALNGGELIGRTRLQKTIYLLDRCGAEFGLPFEYCRYGPYSFELVGGLNDALADERIDVEERPGRHKVRYAVFRTDAERPETLGNLPADRAVSLLGRMKYVSDFVLELAATVVFLRDEWHYFGKDKVVAANAMGAAVEETKRRKALKATPDRLEKALALLRDLGLAEAPVPARGR